MSWLFSRALVEAYSAANCSGGERFAPSKSTPTPQAYLWRDKTTDAWSRFPSGMTCEPLTADRGGAVLTWFREGFPVRTSVKPEPDGGSMGRVLGYGGTWRGSLAKFDRVSSSWRTHGELFVEDCAQSSLIWPEWGMMRDGALWEHRPPVLRKGGKGSGWWPTPMASDSIRCRKFPAWLSKHREKQRANGTGGASGIFEVAAAEFGQLPTISFSEWLNGIPEGWVFAFRPLATSKFRQWLDSHGKR